MTGGVLRGERSRFQLFGDTMEHYSPHGRDFPVVVHSAFLGTATLIQSGGANWVQARTRSLLGQGDMETFWLLMKDTNDAKALQGQHRLRSRIQSPGCRTPDEGGAFY
jgi:hypothetical protein